MLPIRNSVNLILLNEANELLLMQAHDPKTTDVDGSYYGPFWFPVGGKIEEGENLEEAAYRELLEETGLTKDQVELGPIVWHGEFDLVLSGILQRLHQRFMVVKTKTSEVSHSNFTPEEKEVIVKSAWFSLDAIKNCSEVIFPVVLPDYLPAILDGNYPNEPIEIDLAKKPAKR